MSTDENTPETTEAQAPEVAEAEVEVEAPEDEEQADEEQADEETTPAREAKYRRRLRETEQERDDLGARVEALQRAEIERQAEAASVRVAALWASGVELSDLLAETGAVDSAKVEKAVRAARERLGLAGPRLGGTVPREGTVTVVRSGSSWERAFKV